MMLMIEQHLNYITPNTQNIKKYLKEAFSIIFVDTTKNYSDLYFFESKWINKLEATINIKKTILLLYR